MKNLADLQKNIVARIRNIALLLLAASTLTMPLFANCKTEPENYVDKIYRKSIVTYYEVEYPAGSAFDSRCEYIMRDGKRICHIKLVGLLYQPIEATKTPKQYPTLVLNHGSEHLFPADTKFCSHAEYFVPKGYMIFAPFRRGQGDEKNDEKRVGKRSTGIYVTDMIEDWDSANPKFGHQTNCTTRSCYKAQLLRQQADEEVALAMEYLKKRPDVKRDVKNPNGYDIAIMGISYGGAVTVFANRLDLGQKAAVAFSPGAQQWDSKICAPFTPNCGTEFQREQIAAAADAKQPAYYLQGQCDYDTRATIDLAFAHAYGSSDPKHSQPFNAAIFPYNVQTGGTCSPDLYQDTHAGFFSSPNVWGNSVSDFLNRYGVK